MLYVDMKEVLKYATQTINLMNIGNQPEYLFGFGHNNFTAHIENEKVVRITMQRNSNLDLSKANYSLTNICIPALKDKQEILPIIHSATYFVEEERYITRIIRKYPIIGETSFNITFDEQGIVYLISYINSPNFNYFNQIDFRVGNINYYQLKGQDATKEQLLDFDLDYYMEDFENRYYRNIIDNHLDNQHQLNLERYRAYETRAYEKENLSIPTSINYSVRK